MSGKIQTQEISLIKAPDLFCQHPSPTLVSPGLLSVPSGPKNWVLKDLGSFSCQAQVLSAPSCKSTHQTPGKPLRLLSFNPEKTQTCLGFGWGCVPLCWLQVSVWTSVMSACKSGQHGRFDVLHKTRNPLKRGWGSSFPRGGLNWHFWVVVSAWAYYSTKAIPLLRSSLCRRGGEVGSMSQAGLPLDIRSDTSQGLRFSSNFACVGLGFFLVVVFLFLLGFFCKINSHTDLCHWDL